MPKPVGKNEVKINLLDRVTCPHCWEQFSPEDTLWISAHPDLIGDARIKNGYKRFLPTRFNAEGNAIDVEGTICQELACPKCHLQVPRPLLELPPSFVSIAGGPFSGKSYFLTAMTWTLRTLMPRRFQLSFTDADPGFNDTLNRFEHDQFLNEDPAKIVKLDKTDIRGDHLYSSVIYGKQSVVYPRPFLFTIRPTGNHPSAQSNGRLSRLVCLYDNSGESFKPGEDSMLNPVTRHLAKSQAIMFCFDPTQDPRFRNACKGKTEDYQINEAPVTERQEIILHEMIRRIRDQAGMGQSERTNRPLVIVVTKYDAWWSLIGEERLPNPWWPTKHENLCAVDTDGLANVSRVIRELLSSVTPELVVAAEEFSTNTYFLPVSATGRSPVLDEESPGELRGFRSQDMNPMWCGVPMITILGSLTSGLVPH